MHPNVVNEATKYDRHVDLPMWMSSLSLDDDATPYYMQKELECQGIEALQNPGCSQANGDPKKRGPKVTTSLSEKRILRQKEKDQREIRRLMDDILCRLEDKQQEELEFYQKFMINPHQILTDSKQEGAAEQFSSEMQATTLHSGFSHSGLMS